MSGNKKIFFIFLFLLCITYQFAYTGAFDNVELNAKPVGIGEAITAIGDDVNSINYNPAGISKISNTQFLFSYRDFYSLGLINQKYIGFTVPAHNFNICLSWHRIGATSLVEFVNYKEDTYILTLAGRCKGLNNLSAGINLKFFRVFSVSDASGYGLDAGLQYHVLNEKLRFGIFNKNINDVKIYWDTGAKDVLDSEFRIGIGFAPQKKILAAMDFVDEKLNFGFEINIINNKFIFRSGIKNINKKDKTLAAGMSFIFGDLQFDYALTKHRYLDLTHFFSLSTEIKRGKL